MNSSEGNKIDNGAGFQPSEPVSCANGCGFFGAPATMGLCSKCYRDFRIEKEREAEVKAAVKKIVRPHEDKSDSVEKDNAAATTSVEEAAVEKKTAAVSSRCLCCKKKVGVMGFQCRCGSTFCGVHRYPEKHGCTFDYKGQGKEAIAKANPVIKADKMERI